MKKILLCLMAVAIGLTSTAQQYKWGKTFNGYTTRTGSVSVDNFGNKYIIGSMDNNGVSSIDSVDLDPSSGTHMIYSDNGSYFFAKYDINGNFILGKQLEARLTEVKITISGNLLLVANIEDQFGNGVNYDLDPSSNSAVFTTYGSDLLLATYSSADGSFISAKHFQTFEYQQNSGVAFLNNLDIDSQGNISFSGYFKGAVDYDLDGIINNAFNFGTGSTYFLRYDSNFNVLGGYIDSDAGGIIGFQKDPSSPYTYLLGGTTTSSGRKILLSKFDNLNQTFVWKDTMDVSSGAILQGSARDINVDAAGNTYIYGWLPQGGSIDFQPGPGVTSLDGPTFVGGANQNTNGYLAKYKSNGQLVWAKKIQGDPDYSNEIKNMKIDNENKLVCMIGVKNGPLNIANNTIDTAGLFLAIYDTAANLLQCKKMSSYFNPYTAGITLHNKEIYLSGSFVDSVDFDPLTPLGFFTHTSNMIYTGYAGFLAKYNQCPDNFTSLSANICQGSTYPFGSQTLTTPGSYFNSFALGNDCDSMVALQLTVISIDTVVTKTASTLTAHATGTSYQWLNCSNNTAIQGATSKDFTPTASGNYKVVVTKNGCSDTSNCYAVTTTGIEQPAFAQHVNIYPNPTQDKLNIIFNASVRVDNIMVTDFAGRMLYLAKDPKQLSNVVIDVHSFSAGTYILQLKAGNERAMFKFVKK